MQFQQVLPPPTPAMSSTQITPKLAPHPLGWVRANWTLFLRRACTRRAPPKEKARPLRWCLAVLRRVHSALCWQQPRNGKWPPFPSCPIGVFSERGAFLLLSVYAMLQDESCTLLFKNKQQGKHFRTPGIQTSQSIFLGKLWYLHKMRLNNI